MSGKTLIYLGLGLLVLLGFASLGHFSPGTLLSKTNTRADTTTGDYDSVRDTLATINQRSRDTEKRVDREAEARRNLSGDIESKLRVLSDQVSRVGDNHDQRVAELKTTVANLTGTLKNLRKPATQAADLPVGRPQAPADTWILPADYRPGAGPHAVAEYTTARDGQRGVLRDRFAFDASPSDEMQAQDIPVITIPENATLMGATAMTGIFGRVPIGAKVVDPIPFKVVTGAENLASQGWEIPHLENAVWRGEATGDRTLRCATGKLLSVTFVFTDGTIRTVSGSRSKPLGTLSDRRGYPCIPGTFVSDFPKHVAAITAAGAAAGAADAFAASETTTSVTSSGSIVGAVTGNADRFVLGRAGSEAFRELARLIHKRFDDTFDAVVVQPGATVALHVETEIRVDYATGADARKISFIEEENYRVDD